LENPDVVIDPMKECPHVKGLRKLVIDEVLPLLDQYATLKLAGQQRAGFHVAEKLRKHFCLSLSTGVK